MDPRKDVDQVVSQEIEKYQMDNPKGINRCLTQGKKKVCYLVGIRI